MSLHRICDFCGETIVDVYIVVSAVSNKRSDANWAEIVLSGDACQPCAAELNRAVDAMLNGRKRPK